MAVDVVLTAIILSAPPVCDEVPDLLYLASPVFIPPLVSIPFSLLHDTGKIAADMDPMAINSSAPPASEVMVVDVVPATIILSTPLVRHEVPDSLFLASLGLTTPLVSIPFSLLHDSGKIAADMDPMAINSFAPLRAR